MEEPVSDGELIDRFSDGDESAFNELFERYRLMFYSYFARMLGAGSSSVDDMFQVFWVQILNSLKSCRERDKFKCWAFAIARNQVRRFWRKKRLLEKFFSFPAKATFRNVPWTAIR